MTDNLNSTNAPYYSEIHRYGFRMLKSESKADDFVQEVYTRYIASGQNFEGTRLRNWLFRTARNLVIDIYRSHERHNETQEDENNPIANQPDVKNSCPATIVEQQDIIQNVLASLERCEKRTREVFRLKFYEGKSSSEIGTKLGISSSTVRKILLGKLQKFREVYQ